MKLCIDFLLVWILEFKANFERNFQNSELNLEIGSKSEPKCSRFSALNLEIDSDFRRCLNLACWGLSESWGLDIMHDWRFNQFSVFSALNLEIASDEILDWRAAYYVNFGDLIDSSAVLMTWWRDPSDVWRDSSTCNLLVGSYSSAILRPTAAYSCVSFKRY